MPTNVVDFVNFKLGLFVQNLYIPNGIVSQILPSAIWENGKLKTRLQMKKNKIVLNDCWLEALDNICAFKHIWHSSYLLWCKDLILWLKALSYLF